MRLTSLFLQETAVEVFDQVGTAPVQLRGHRGHKGGHETGKQNSQDRMRRLARRYQHITALGLRKSSGKHDPAKSRQNPRPPPQLVARKLEPEYGQQSVPL